MTFAPAFSRMPTSCALALAQARDSGVSPYSLARLTSAPAVSRELGSGKVVRVDGEGERRGSVGLGGIHVGTLVQQGLDGFQVAIADRIEQPEIGGAEGGQAKDSRRRKCFKPNKH